MPCPIGGNATAGKTLTVSPDPRQQVRACLACCMHAMPCDGPGHVVWYCNIVEMIPKRGKVYVILGKNSRLGIYSAFAFPGRPSINLVICLDFYCHHASQFCIHPVQLQQHLSEVFRRRTSHARADGLESSLLDER